MRIETDLWYILYIGLIYWVLFFLYLLSLKLLLDFCSIIIKGADNIRKYWSRYYQGSQGVIFVLDSASSEDDLEIARNELHSALQHPQLCTLPFLILANHQDKPAARSVQEVCVNTAICFRVLAGVRCWVECNALVCVHDRHASMHACAFCAECRICTG